jgi:MraZ protein
MTGRNALLEFESLRNLDERGRLKLPEQLDETIQPLGKDWWLVKERPGALSLWPFGAPEENQLEEGKKVLLGKLGIGRLQDKTEDVLTWGRLLSTRRTKVTLDSRNRFTLPESFRTFLGVEAGGEVYVVGAAVCIEVWRKEAWIQFVEQRMPEFRRLFEQLTS